MLNGFSNDNVGRNRFMSRTKQMSNNFANAIGTTTTTTQKLSGCGAGGKCPTCYRCKGGTCYPAYQVVIQGEYTPTLADFNNCMGLYGTSKFDGGFANAIGTPTKFNPVGYTPQKCGSGNSCPKGTYCLSNATNVATGETANWCVPFEQSAKFDGGFANATGTPIRGARPLVYNPNNNYKNASGDCGCGCKGAGNCNGDPILGF